MLKNLKCAFFCVLLSFLTTVPTALFAANVLNVDTPKVTNPKFEKLVLSDKFYAEGANVADLNRDGFPDVIAGPFWYEGPDFQKKHEIYPPEAFNPEAYSDNFFCYTGDFNRDGWIDVFICPHPGTQSYWYENPKGEQTHWKKHLALEELGNESPMWGDVLKNGRIGPIYNMNGYLGFGTYEVRDGAPQWKFHQVSDKQDRYQRYTHGIGYGDINGDERNDIIESIGWWEQPEKIVDGQPWKFYPFKFAEAGAQLLIYDVNGDGNNDVITSWHCHLYGLLWYEQIRSDNGEITWKKHEILSSTPDKNSADLRISQMHAFYPADMNNDGLLDFVVGKRYWAHGSKGDEEPNAPAVIYWFELRRDAAGNVTFIPHLIDDDSGVGTQVVVADVNKDGIPDTVVSNKKGTFICFGKK